MQISFWEIYIYIATHIHQYMYTHIWYVYTYTHIGYLFYRVRAFFIQETHVLLELKVEGKWK